MRTLVPLFVLSAAVAGEIPQVETAGARLRAGDLAAALPAWGAADPNLDLGPAPAPGIRRSVSPPQLDRWARAAAVAAPAEGWPSRLEIVRAVRRWPAGEARETLSALVAAGEGVETQAVEVRLSGFREPEIPAGTLDWSFAATAPRTPGPAPVALRWRDGGGRSGVETVVAEVRVERRTAAAPAKSAPKPAVVERGDVVELAFSAGPIRLRAQARAEGAGAEGELVPFRNLATNRRVLARVVDARTAEVPAP